MELERIKDILAEAFNLDPSEITADTKLTEELGADSMDLFQVASEVGEEFEVEIPLDGTVRIRTVRDILEYIRKS